MSKLPNQGAYIAPKTFSELQVAFRSGSWIITRTKDIQEQYEIEKQKGIPQHEKVGVEWTACLFSQEIQKSFGCIFVTPKAYLVKAKFAYDIPSDCEHFVLFLSQNITLSEKQIRKLIEKWFPVGSYILFTNDPANRSVPQIAHWHVIAKKQTVRGISIKHIRNIVGLIIYPATVFGIFFAALLWLLNYILSTVLFQ